MYVQYLETKCTCISCDVCVILLVLQILDNVSPNPAKAVTARKNRKKNRFDQFLPGMYHLNDSSVSCNAETHNYSHSLFQLTDGECNSRERTRIISSLLQSTSVNTLLHVSEDSIDIRILLSCMSVRIV